MNISKSDFLKYRECSSYFWMYKHARDLITEKPLSAFDRQLMEQGREVELWARKLFPKGLLIRGNGAEAQAGTVKALEEGVEHLFQPAIASDGLYARIDVLEVTASGCNLYEVKGTTAKGKKEIDHYFDAGFQREVLRRAGFQVEYVFLIELNKEFVKSGPIDPTALVTVTDITEELDNIQNELLFQIEDAQNKLTNNKAPTTCGCIEKPRKYHCPTFAMFHPQVSHYAAHDLARIGNSPKRLRALLDDGFYNIEDIPVDYDLTKIQLNQVRVHNLDTPIIRPQRILDNLQKLEYPFYFLDYETYPAAVPVFDGCYPFQQVPFQYSLHIQTAPDSTLEHREYLHTDESHPMKGLAEALRRDMADAGSVIVWNKRFEGKCNDDMSILIPELAPFFKGINNRFYDLADIFSRQYYVHKGFRGKYSIKNVLPVLCPTLSYNSLDIRDGGAACAAWKCMMFEKNSTEEVVAIRKSLLSYCKLDTLAMVEILRVVEAFCPQSYHYHRKSRNQDFLQSMLEASLAR